MQKACQTHAKRGLPRASRAKLQGRARLGHGVSARWPEAQGALGQTRTVALDEGLPVQPDSMLQPT